MGAQAWRLQGYRPLALLALAMAVATLWALVVVLPGAEPTPIRTGVGPLAQGLHQALSGTNGRDVSSEYHVTQLGEAGRWRGPKTLCRLQSTGCLSGLQPGPQSAHQLLLSRHHDNPGR